MRCLLVTLILTAWAQAVDFSRLRFVVVAGGSAGPLRLGQKPDEAIVSLGTPDFREPERLIWGAAQPDQLKQGVEVLLRDGRIHQIRLCRVRAISNAGLWIGCPQSEVLHAYPHAIEGHSNRTTSSWRVPGLTVLTRLDKVEELWVTPINEFER